MNGRDLGLEGRIDESMSGEAVLLLEEGRDDDGLEALTASA